MEIIETAWDWASPLSPRYATDEIILHHAAGDASAQSVHAAHLALGWSGIAYHYYVRKDGGVWRGRPEDAVGNHTGGRNERSIGVCFEGNFQTDVMGEPQLNAGRELIAELRARYPGVSIIGHRDANMTACPGQNFPFEELSGSMTGEEIYRLLTQYLASLPESGWSRDEGDYWRKAVEAGLVDGTNPRGFITREQMTALLGRLGLIE